MPVPDNPSVARVVLNCQRDTRKFVNVFHMMRGDDAVLNITDLETMTAVIADWWTDAYRTTVIDIVVSESAVATKLDPDDPIQDQNFFSAAGSVASPAVRPGNVSAVMSWRTGLAGRKHRGRSYHVGIDGDQILSTDNLVGFYLAQLTAAATDLLTKLTIEGLKAVVFHRVDDTTTDIVGVVVDQLVDSMRTRLAGRGV